MKKFQNEQDNLKCFYHDRIHTVYWTDVDWIKKPYKANTDDNLHDFKYTTRKCNGQLICQASMKSGGIKQVLWAQTYLIWGTNYDRGMPISLQCLSRSCSADKECFSGCRSPFLWFLMQSSLDRYTFNMESDQWHFVTFLFEHLLFTSSNITYRFVS
jgi:hypothetical protein